MLIPNSLISPLCLSAKESGKSIVFTNGCFDILHAGHVMYLEKSSKLGDILIIGLNSDESVRRLKGNSRPINSEIDRAVVLSALKFVDFVTIFDTDTPLELIKMILPDILVKGGDYTLDKIIGAEEVINNGGRVEIIPLLDGRSTTNTIKKMQNQ